MESRWSAGAFHPLADQGNIVASLLLREAHQKDNWLMSESLPVITAICDRLVHTLKPERLLLFGSYAKCVHTERSDVDILVITRTPIALPQRAALHMLFCDFPVRVDLVFYTQSQLEVEAKYPYSFAYTILLNSVLLYPVLEA